jgi:uncharacterized protein involved in exopolysaccharide biosynthesis
MPNPEQAINDEIQIIKSEEFQQRLAREVPPTNKAASSELMATPIKQASLIEISLTSPHPEWAISAVNRAAKLYLEEHLKVHKTKGVEEFYDEQEKRLQTELTKAEGVLSEFQENEKIVDTSIEVPSGLQSLASFEKNLKETDSTIRRPRKNSQPRRPIETAAGHHLDSKSIGVNQSIRRSLIR